MGLELLRVNQYPAVSTAGRNTLAKTKTAKTSLQTRSFPAPDAGHAGKRAARTGGPPAERAAHLPAHPVGSCAVSPVGSCEVGSCLR